MSESQEGIQPVESPIKFGESFVGLAERTIPQNQPREFACFIDQDCLNLQVGGEGLLKDDLTQKSQELQQKLKKLGLTSVIIYGQDFTQKDLIRLLETLGGETDPQKRSEALKNFFQSSTQDGQQREKPLAIALIGVDGKIYGYQAGDAEIVVVIDQEAKKLEQSQLEGQSQLKKGEGIFVGTKGLLEKMRQMKRKEGERLKNFGKRLTQKKPDGKEPDETSLSGGELDADQSLLQQGRNISPDSIDSLQSLAGERVRRHHPPFIVDNPNNQSDALSFEEVRSAIESPQIQPTDPEKIKRLKQNITLLESLINSDVLKEILPKKPNETDQDYRKRVLEEVTQRMRFPGDYEKGEGDSISRLLIEKGLRGEVITPQLLQAIEAIQVYEIHQRNQERLKAWEEAKKQGRWEIPTLVSFERGVVNISGAMDVFEDTPEGRKRKEMAERDMRAALLLTNAFSNLPYEIVIDPQSGGKKTITFQEKIKPLLEKRRAAPTDEEREEISRQIQGEYKIYLQKLTEAMKKREWLTNPFSDDEPFQKAAYDFLQQLKPPFNQEKFELLINLHAQNLPERLKESTTRRLRETFGKDIGALPDFLGYAQKGIDFLERRMELLRIPKPQLEEVPQTIFAKVWKEEGEYQGANERWVIEGAATRRGNRRLRPTAPAYEGKPDQKPPEPPTAPISEGGRGQEPPEPPVASGENPPAAPSGENPPAAPSGENPPASERLEPELNIAFVSDPTRVEQEIGALAQHYRARTKQAMGLKALISPREWPQLVRNIWQNTFFDRLFTDRAIRFEQSLTQVARQRVGLDSSVVFQLSPEIMENALEGGRELRKKAKWWQKIGYGVRDLWSGITGIGQNTEMILARKWLSETTNTSDLDKLKRQSLTEQNQFAQRFTLGEVAGHKPISEEMGEKRYLIDQVIPDQRIREGFQAKIKELAVAVIQGSPPLKEEDALKELNSYYKTEVFARLDKKTQDELKGIEISSNFSQIIHYLKETDALGRTRLARYQEEKTQDGRSRWEELQFKIYLGRGRYETARGDIELTPLQRKLIQRMMERQDKKENPFVWSTLSGANGLVEFLRDAVAYGGAYIGGAAASGKIFGQKMAFGFLHLNPLAGTAAMSVMAGLKEGPAIARRGKLLGIGGKTWRDFVQVSRESAWGRGSDADARLRKQFEQALVSQERAVDLTSKITQLLEKAQKESLTDEEKKQLMVAIAHAQARLRLTDLSTQRGKRLLGIGEIEVPQNFITYNQETRNQELTALRAAILQGYQRLVILDPNLVQQTENIGKVIEAQLRVGSVQEKLAGVIARENKISVADAQDLVNQFFQIANLNIAKEKSLEGAARTLAKLSLKRSAQVVPLAAATGLVGIVAFAPLKAIVGEGINLYKDIVHAGDFGKGLQEWATEWGQVLRGDVPIEVHNGQPVIDLSSVQKAVLKLETLFHSPPADVVSLTGVDGSELGRVNFDSRLHFQAGDYDGDGDIDTLLIDRGRGEIVTYFQDKQFNLSDINGDGKLDLVFTDNTGHQIDAIAELRRHGINVHVSEVTQTTRETVLDLSQSTGYHEVTIQGHQLQIPNGTEIHDNGNGTFDIVAKDVHGNEVVLVDEAHFDANGKLVIDPNKLVTGFSHQIDSQILQEQKTENVAEVWDRIVYHDKGKNIWWTNATQGSDYQELRLYNQVYQASDGSLGVRFIFPSGQGSLDGVNFHDVQQVATNSQFGPQLHLFIPGIGHLPIDMSSDGDSNSFDFNLDLNNHHEISSNGQPVLMPDGHHMTVADLARILINQQRLAEHLQHEGITVGSTPTSLATEYRGWLDVFNLGNEGRNGFIVAGFTDENGVFNHLATIRGSGALGEIVTTIQTEIPRINLQGLIEAQKEIRTPTFYLSTESPVWDISPILIPWRENIERSDLPNTTSSPSPESTPASAVLTEEERREREEIRNDFDSFSQRVRQMPIEEIKRTFRVDEQTANKLRQDDEEGERARKELFINKMADGLAAKGVTDEVIAGLTEEEKSLIQENSDKRWYTKDESEISEGEKERYRKHRELKNRIQQTLLSPEIRNKIREKAESYRKKLRQILEEEVSPRQTVQPPSQEPATVSRPEPVPADQTGQPTTIPATGTAAQNVSLPDSNEVKEARLSKTSASGKAAHYLSIFYNSLNPAQKDNRQIDLTCKFDLRSDKFDPQTDEPKDPDKFDQSFSRVWEFVRSKKGNVPIGYLESSGMQHVVYIDGNNKIKKIVFNHSNNQFEHVLLSNEELRNVRFFKQLEEKNPSGWKEVKEIITANLSELSIPGSRRRDSKDPNSAGVLDSDQSINELNQQVLAARVKELKDHISSLTNNKEILKSNFLITADSVDNKLYFWQGVILGREVKSQVPGDVGGAFLYRGYLQVEPEDIPLAVEILLRVGKEREKQGKATNFKWLIGVMKSSDTVADLTGNYRILSDQDPRVAIYSETKEEVEEILRELADQPEWTLIEQKRLSRTPARRAGVQSLNHKGREWRTLNYNPEVGFSENELERDPFWRFKESKGTPTIELINKSGQRDARTNEILTRMGRIKSHVPNYGIPALMFLQAFPSLLESPVDSNFINHFKTYIAGLQDESLFNKASIFRASDEELKNFFADLIYLIKEKIVYFRNPKKTN